MKFLKINVNLMALVAVCLGNIGIMQASEKNNITIFSQSVLEQKLKAFEADENRSCSYGQFNKAINYFRGTESSENISTEQIRAILGIGENRSLAATILHDEGYFAEKGRLLKNIKDANDEGKQSMSTTIGCVIATGCAGFGALLATRMFGFSTIAKLAKLATGIFGIASFYKVYDIYKKVLNFNTHNGIYNKYIVNHTLLTNGYWIDCQRKAILSTQSNNVRFSAK